MEQIRNMLCDLLVPVKDANEALLLHANDAELGWEFSVKISKVS